MPGVEVAIEWKQTTGVPDHVRRKVNRLLRSLGPVLNEYEANLFDMSNLASNGLDYLMPRIELNLPMYEDNYAFRVRMTRLDTTQICLVTKHGDPVADVYLV